MKHPRHTVGLFVFVACALLAACSGTPTDDTVLPTVAQLPTAAPLASAQVVPTLDPNATLSLLPAAGETVTEFPIILPGTFVGTEIPTAESDTDLETFPDTLEVGSKVTLQGTFTTTDVNSGAAVLTNSKQQTINLMVDSFTAMSADNQVVQISGEVVQQPGDPSKAVQVTDIRMVNGASAIPTATDFPIDNLPTPTQEGS